MQDVMRQIRRLVARPTPGTRPDEDLLDLFVRERAAEPFAELVHRHGPMVMGVCLRLLRHRQDAEDAFQATFLTLVRKGHTIRQRGALPSWLYRVAFRIALRLKARCDRHEAPERLTDVEGDIDPAEAAGWRELRPVLDQEVQRLPIKYRTPMVLCYLEGKTYEEAAELIGCPKGTVAIRLLRGRQMLKTRLVRRGLIAAAGCVAAQAVVPSASAAVPAALGAATTAAAAALTSGAALGAVVPSGVATLVHEAGRSLGVPKLHLVCATVLCLGLSGVGIGVGVNESYFGKPSSGATSTPVFAEQSQAAALPASPAAGLVAPPPAVAARNVSDEPARYFVVQIDYASRTSACEDVPVSVHGAMTLSIDGDALDEARARGGMILLPRANRCRMILLPRPNSTPPQPHASSGLAFREMLRDDSLIGGPRREVAFLPDRAPSRASSIQIGVRKSVRTITLTEESSIRLFNGAVRIIYLIVTEPASQRAGGAGAGPGRSASAP